MRATTNETFKYLIVIVRSETNAKWLGVLYALRTRVNFWGGERRGARRKKKKKRERKKNAGTENGQRYFPWSQRSADVELIARVKFKFREFDSSIEDRERVHRWSREPYGLRAPSMEIMGHDYTKKTLSGIRANSRPEFYDTPLLLCYFIIALSYPRYLFYFSKRN